MISENLKKTIIGIVAAIASILVVMGFITPEQAEAVNSGLTGMLENIGGVILGFVAVWGIFTGGKE